MSSETPKKQDKKAGDQGLPSSPSRLSKSMSFLFKSVSSRDNLPAAASPPQSPKSLNAPDLKSNSTEERIKRIEHHVNTVLTALPILEQLTDIAGEFIEWRIKFFSSIRRTVQSNNDLMPSLQTLKDSNAKASRYAALLVLHDKVKALELASLKLINWQPYENSPSYREKGALVEKLKDIREKSMESLSTEIHSFGMAIDKNDWMKRFHTPEKEPQQPQSAQEASPSKGL